MKTAELERELLERTKRKRIKWRKKSENNGFKNTKKHKIELINKTKTEKIKLKLIKIKLNNYEITASKSISW